MTRPVLLTCCAVVGLHACVERLPLDQVPIIGATPEQESALNEELERFQLWAGPARVTLAAIEFADLADTRHGRYNSVSARIRLDADLTPRELPIRLRHELCHAVDYQEGLLDRKHGVFDTLVDAIDRDPTHPLHHELSKGSKRLNRAEAMAYMCQQAPLGTRLLASPCPDDPMEYLQAAKWIMDTVWTGDPDVVEHSALLAPHAEVRWYGKEPIAQLQMLGSERTGAAVLIVQQADSDAHDEFVDLATAEEIPAFWDVDVSTPGAALPAELPFGTPPLEPYYPAIVSRIWSVADEDEALVIVEGFRAIHLERTLRPHLLAFAEGSWSIVEDSCPGEKSTVFMADGTFYVGWVADTDVEWMPLEVTR